MDRLGVGVPLRIWIGCDGQMCRCSWVSLIAPRLNCVFGWWIHIGRGGLCMEDDRMVISVLFDWISRVARYCGSGVSVDLAVSGR